MNITDKIKIPKHLDKRRKLTDKQKDNIKYLYFTKQNTIRAIARKYQFYCSRRLIQFVLFPERDAKLKALRSKTKAHLKYYNKEKHNACVKDLRQRKRKIFKIKVYTPTTFLNENKEEKNRILKLIKNNNK